ncbi:MAG: EMC3/TMCO1 family protein [Candidatus Bathyarchaeota archaeon]|jgi:uncharacterized membrane protein (DUF106 family)|nr:EMC3/TMCO1 family protein [Candidatus Bathyarchaeota archaeon]MDH5791911.1 EMC3/TMCO1 family protein [Candidatus Bathyarchaeota archaeon]
MIDILSVVAAADLSFLQQPPVSTVFILLLTAAINLVMTLASRRTMNLDEYRRMMEEANYAQRELMAAMRSGNQRRISRAQKRQQETSQQQLKSSGGRMKTSIFFIIPLFILWPILRNFFGANIIAYVPFDAPLLGATLSMFNWYFLCSLATNIIFQRVLGLTFEIEPREIEE